MKDSFKGGGVTAVRLHCDGNRAERRRAGDRHDSGDSKAANQIEEK